MGRSTSLDRSAITFVGGTLLILVLMFGGVLGYYGIQYYCHQPGNCGTQWTQKTFDNAIANESSLAGTQHYNFTMGTVVYYNQSLDNHNNVFRLAIIVPTDFVPVNYTTTQPNSTTLQAYNFTGHFIAVAVPSNVTVGNMVNIVGNLDKAENITTGATIYFIRSQSLQVYGSVNTKDPNYNGLYAMLLFWQNEQNISKDQANQQSYYNNNFFFNYWVIWYFMIYSPNYYGGYDGTGDSYDSGGDGMSTDGTSSSDTGASDSSSSDGSSSDGGGDAGASGGE